MKDIKLETENIRIDYIRGSRSSLSISSKVVLKKQLPSGYQYILTYSLSLVRLYE